MEQRSVWYMGVDWGRARHQACVMTVSGEVLGNQSFVHSGVGLLQLVQWCVQLTGADAASVHVGIETPHGPVVATLLAHGFKVHSINPSQLNRFRDRHSPSGAKDDRRDAKVLADALRTDGHAFRHRQPGEERSSRLSHLLRSHRHLVGERTRMSNRFCELLWNYYPQFQELSDSLTLAWVLALWKLVPSPQRARRVRLSSVEKLLRRHSVRIHDAQQIVDVLRQPALSVPQSEVNILVDEINLIVARLELVQKQAALTQKKLDRCLQDMDRHPAPLEVSLGEAHSEMPGIRPSDVAIVQSLPGAGRIVTATLLAKASDALQDRNYGALRCLCGVAPVTRSSGRMHVVNRRRAADRQLCDAAYHWARTAIQHDSSSRSQYRRLRKKGHSHGRALRSVADRLLAVLCAMLRNGTLFECGQTPVSPVTAGA